MKRLHYKLKVLYKKETFICFIIMVGQLLIPMALKNLINCSQDKIYKMSKIKVKNKKL